MFLRPELCSGRDHVGQERRSISVKAPPSAPAHFRMGVDRGASCHTSTNHTEHVSVASSAGSKGNKVSGPGTLALGQYISGIRLLNLNTAITEQVNGNSTT